MVQLKGNVALAHHLLTCVFNVALSCTIHVSLVIFKDKIFVGASKTTKSATSIGYIVNFSHTKLLSFVVQRRLSFIFPSEYIW